MRLVADVALADVEGPIDTLLVPGSLVLGPDGPMPTIVPEIVATVKRLAPSCRRVVSVYAGASMLAEAGLLDGKTVTTHWFGAAQLAKDYPRVNVDADPIFVRDGSVWTCAGVNAGMDLTLALVADDHGEQPALNTARLLVMYLKRPGGQSQFSVPLSLQAPARDDIRELQLWIADNLNADLSVPVLARRMHMSVRHFARVFRQATGSTRGLPRSRSRRGRPPGARGDRPVPRRRRRCLRLRLGRDPLPLLPPPPQHHPRRLPPPLPHPRRRGRLTPPSDRPSSPVRPSVPVRDAVAPRVSVRSTDRVGSPDASHPHRSRRRRLADRRVPRRQGDRHPTARRGRPRRRRALAASQWRRRGPVVTGVLLTTYLGGFGASHPLAKKIGTWPAVISVAAVSGVASYVLADRHR